MVPGNAIGQQLARLSGPRVEPLGAGRGMLDPPFVVRRQLVYDLVRMAQIGLPWESGFAIIMGFAGRFCEGFTAEAAGELSRKFCYLIEVIFEKMPSLGRLPLNAMGVEGKQHPGPLTCLGSFVFILS